MQRMGTIEFPNSGRTDLHLLSNVSMATKNLVHYGIELLKWPNCRKGYLVMLKSEFDAHGLEYIAPIIFL